MIEEEIMATGMNANVWDVTESIQALIRSGRSTRRGWPTLTSLWTR
jgi:hypothetical protein